jgi:hypothetical protein
MKALLGNFFILFLFWSSEKLNAQSLTLFKLTSDQVTLKEKLQSNGLDKKSVLAIQEIITKGKTELDKGPYSVVDKSTFPPSKDKHDYLSLAPYFWPDPSKIDGLPWIRKDGEVNPLTRENNTDQVRKNRFFNAINNLANAYYYSNDSVYFDRIKYLVEIWFLNPETRMNPNLNFGQGIPGVNTGRPAGIIEILDLKDMLKVLSYLKMHNPQEKEFYDQFDQWIGSFRNWLMNSELGIKEREAHNNHGSVYDVLLGSIYIYENKSTELKALLNRAKHQRLELHIDEEGKQNAELARTKALSYSRLNLEALLTLCEFGKMVDVDLWNYNINNQSYTISKAFDFLKPFVFENKPWPYQQISSMQNEISTIKNLFSRASHHFNYQKIDKSSKNFSFYIF